MLMGSRAFLVGFAMVEILATPVNAKHFENSYVAFDLPDNWTCALEETEWVCKPPSDANGRTAMIAILTAKIVGKEDSPQSYIRHLQERGNADGIEILKTPEDQLIGQTIWLDATLLNSELPDYETRYLARTEGRLGVLVTFSAHRGYEAQAKPISDMIAGSVQVNPNAARLELQP